MDVLVWPDELLSKKKMIDNGRVILAKGSKTQKGIYALGAIELLNE